MKKKKLFGEYLEALAGRRWKCLRPTMGTIERAAEYANLAFFILHDVELQVELDACLFMRLNTGKCDETAMAPVSLPILGRCPLGAPYRLSRISSSNETPICQIFREDN